MTQGKEFDQAGGTAFPFATTEGTMTSGSWAASPGMTLLDYFAAQLLQGWLVSRESDVLLAKCGGDWEEAAEQAAVAAYMVARAMLRARKQHPSITEGGEE